MLDLEEQLRRYADHVEGQVPEVPASQPGDARRSHLAWLMAAAAAAAVIVGAAVTLSRSGEAEDDVVTEPTNTIVVESPSGADFDVILTASVGLGAGSIDSVGVSNLEVLGGIGQTEPWLRFDLLFDYRSGSKPDLVFERGTDGWRQPLGSGLEIRGPLCTGRVRCGETAERRLELRPTTRTSASFEVYREVDNADPVNPGVITAEIEPVLDREEAKATDDPIPLELNIYVSGPIASPNGDTTPVDTGSQRVSVVGGSFELRKSPFVAVADDQNELNSIVREGDIGELDIDWDTRAVVVFAIPTDACPPVLADLAIDNQTAQPVWANPGYLACIQPLLSHTVIASVDREYLSRAEQLRLPPDRPYFQEPVTTEIGIDVDSGPGDDQPIEEPGFGESSGQIALPPRGEARLGALDNGTPVFLVHHHDGTISALDPRTETGETGRLKLVHWIAATRNFLGQGAWDEYGRSIDGFRSTDLRGFATRVTGDVVEVGSPVPAPAGSPITLTDNPPAMLNVETNLSAPKSVAEALEAKPGQVVIIDAQVIRGPAGAFICVPPPSSTPGVIEPCPAGSPPAEGVGALQGARETWPGPLIATRTPTGFTEIAARGGGSGGGL